MLRLVLVLSIVFLLTGCGLTEPNVVACGDDCPGVSMDDAGGRGGDHAGTGGSGESGSTGGGGSDAATAGTGGTAAHGDAGNAGASGAGGQGGADGGGAGADAGCGSCPPATPHCAATECAQCLDDTHCQDSVCVQNACVPCRADADCTQRDASRCVQNQCVACADSTHCAHLAETPVCDEGTCVQCSAGDALACGSATGGATYVCDVLARTCTTHTRRSAGLCDPCVSDEQCAAGQLCAMQRFDEVGDDPDQGEIDVGYFCFWREDATEPTAPAGDCVNVRPYVATLANSESIAGTEATLCGLAVTTCAAYKDYRTKPCTGLDDDATCGDERFDSDGYCEMFSASTYRCTTRCGSADDCRTGFMCNVASVPEHCSLQ